MILDNYTTHKQPKVRAWLAGTRAGPSTSCRPRVGREFGVDGIEEADELLMPVALHAAADHLALQHVQGGKQGRRAVALVIVGARRWLARLHRQRGLRAGERLDLALLIDRKHDSMGRRVDVEPNDVTQLCSEGRVGGELELPDPMRL